MHPGPYSLMPQYQVLRSRLHGYLATEIETDAIQLSTMSEDQARTYISAKVFKFVASVDDAVDARQIEALTADMIDELLGYGPLQSLIEDDDVNDILVNGAHNIFIEQDGVLYPTGYRFADDEHVLRVMRRILTPLGHCLDESSPIVDARLPDGSRINVIIPPLARNGPCVSIRKFRKEPFSGEELIAFGTLSREMLDFLLAAVERKVNIMISGGTGSGKTTLLNLMSRAILPGERIVTIEDAAELRLHHGHVVSLETKAGDLEGEGEVTARTLVRNALRMRPDRIILGEIRGDEVMDMLQAMNTGHEGSMSTIHANSPEDALLRIELLAGLAGFRGSDQTLRKMIAASLDLIVQVSRTANGDRRVMSIVEVLGVRDQIFVTHELYSYDSVRQEFVAAPTPASSEKLRTLFRGR
ncbi:MAG TPA: CpaF family protein [Methylophilaceae bacterium]|jgi:pilus assembly protein CpaF